MTLTRTPAKEHFRWGQSDKRFLTTSIPRFNSNVCKIGRAQQKTKSMLLWKKAIKGTCTIMRFETSHPVIMFSTEKKNPEGTIINKQCVFIIRGKSVVFSSKTWSGRNTITVWHAVYFSFYNKPRVQGIWEFHNH